MVFYGGRAMGIEAEDVIRAKNDNEYFNEFFKKNKNLIWYCIIKTFGSLSRACEACNCDKDELFSVASLGFVKAVRNYDPTKGFNFSTYAYAIIEGELKKFRRDNLQIKIPRTTKDIISKYCKLTRDEDVSSEEAFEIIRNMRDKNGVRLYNDETIDEAREYLGVNVISFEDVFFDNDKDNSKITYEDILASHDDVEDKILSNMLLDELKKELYPYLNDCEIKAFEAIVFENKTQSEVAEIINMSQCQVSRILKYVRELIDVYLSFCYLGGVNMGRNKYEKHIEFIADYIKNEKVVPTLQQINLLLREQNLEELHSPSYYYIKTKILKLLEAQGYNINEIKDSFKRKPRKAKHTKIENQHEGAKVEDNKIIEFKSKPKPTEEKEVISFIGKVAYINRKGISMDHVNSLFEMVNIFAKSEQIYKVNLKLKLEEFKNEAQLK